MSERTDELAGWRDLLQPWAEKYAELDHAINEHVGGLDDADLIALGDACKKPTTTNCWWATYQVSDLVLQRVRGEQYARHRARSDAQREAEEDDPA